MIIKVTIGEVKVETNTGGATHTSWYGSEVKQVVDDAIRAYEAMYPEETVDEE